MVRMNSPTSFHRKRLHPHNHITFDLSETETDPKTLSPSLEAVRSYEFKKLEDCHRRALESNFREDSVDSTHCKPSLPSFREVLRQVESDTMGETSHSAHWQRVLHPSPGPRQSLSVFNCTDATRGWPFFETTSKYSISPVLHADYSSKESDPHHYSAPDSPHSSLCKEYQSQRSDSSPHQTEDSYYTSSRRLLAQTGHSHSQTPPRSPSPSYVSTSTCSDTGDVDLPDEPAPDAMNWEEYTRTSVNDDGKIEYECLWPNHPQSSGICGFKRKKQGVKRHIEAKHLGIRRHICSYCEKSFSTKLAVNSHTWRKHTGEKPLTCRYECGKRFNDPARQFRHYESAHGYVSRNPRRKNPR